MASTIAELQDRLWKVADNLRANSDLKVSEYSNPVYNILRNSDREKQNSCPFGKIEKYERKKDNEKETNSLYPGIQGKSNKRVY
jgi:type I restriction-modification system DNA methylase subunit